MDRSIILIPIFFSLFTLGEVYCCSPAAFTKSQIFLQTNKQTIPEKKYLKSNESQDTVYGFYVSIIKDATKMKEYGRAIEAAKKMFLYAEQQEDTLQMAKARFQEAFLNVKLPNLVESNKLYAQAIYYAEIAQEKDLLISLHLNKADVERNLGDFFQAQQTVQLGLNYLEEKKDSLAHYQLYNTLGIACNDAGEYTNAQNAYTNGLQYASTLKQRAALLNNMAVNYKEQQNYIEAIKIYNGLLAEPGLEQHPETEARILDNLGYALFKTGNYGALKIMEKSLAQRVQLGDFNGQFASNIHLAEFYIDKNNLKALAHAQNAMEIAILFKSPDWQLEALEYLIKLKKEPSLEAARYFFLKDSMDRASQALRNEYISSKFLTAEKDKENLTLKQQNVEQALLTEKEKTHKLALGGGLIASIAGLGIFFLVYRRNQKQKREIENQKNLVEKLQRELHHRLKNNLSFIDLFISLAKGKFPDPAYREKLDELQNRITSMFEVHKQLFKKDDVTSVNAKTYIAALVENVKKAYAAPNIILVENIASTNLRADTSFPIGLIVNEFVTNSYKYAFPNKQEGIISIQLTEESDHYLLRLADNGRGLPKDFEIDNLATFGMETIKLLTQEYKGTFKMDGNNGLKMQITFPKAAA